MPRCLRAAEMVGQAWPEQAYESMAVVALHRPEGLTAGDAAYARRLAARFECADRPREVLRVLGPLSQPEIADRLVSRDRTRSSSRAAGENVRGAGLTRGRGLAPGRPGRPGSACRRGSTSAGPAMR